MAFVKRTWLARIGIGLNKFLIGDKDSQGKQTLVNDPDTISQEGDVISADNLNDLEDRIESAVGSLETEVQGIRLTKVWENEHPDEDMGGYPPPTADIGEDTYEFVIEYRHSKSVPSTNFRHFKMTGSSGTGSLFDISLWSSGHVMYDRDFDFDRVGTGGNLHSQLTFYSCKSWDGSTSGTDNGILIPVAVYKVTNIYNS